MGLVNRPHFSLVYSLALQMAARAVFATGIGDRSGRAAHRNGRAFVGLYGAVTVGFFKPGPGADRGAIAGLIVP